MTIKEYSTLLKFSELEPHYQFSVVSREPLLGWPYSSTKDVVNNFSYAIQI